MKKALLIFLFVLLSFKFAISQVPNKVQLPLNPNPETLSKTYGYIKGQHFTLEKIKKEYPSLEFDIIRCESEFNLAFANASENIISELKRLLGSEFKNYENQILETLESMLSQQNITEEVAINFIQDVRQRANGNIESPILETLLTYQYINNPVQEFSSGFINTYSTKGHPKSKGLTINVELPISWKHKEGNRPHVVQKFVSEIGKGLEVILIMVQDLGLPSDYVFTKEELNDIFSESELRNMRPDGSDYISAKRITLDRQIGGQVIFKTTQERLDFSLTVQSIHYITIYDGKMVFLQCTVTAGQADNLSDRFNLLLPLFRQVANSFIIMNQY